ncbi:hypothetical protein PV646_22585 [Streptomyces sp. ID05-26A]|nr:hypothetical protein [Streptomyces sp. ID05-26A]
MLLPTARGPVSAGVIAALLSAGSTRPSGTTDDPEELTGDADFQLALWIVLETLDGGFEGVTNDHPDLVHWRTWLSERWARALRQMTAPVVRAAGGDTASPSLIGDHLISLMRDGHTGVYTFAEHRASAAQLRELLATKSLSGSPGHTLVDRVPAVALAAHNTMRMLSHSTTPAAALGHQATSAARSWLSERKLDRGLRRAGLQPATTLEAPEHRWDRLLDECRTHLAENPGRTQDLLHGAAAAIVLEARLGRHLLRCWAQATPVLEPVPTFPVIGEQSRTRARLLTSIPADPDEGRSTDVRCG